MILIAFADVAQCGHSVQELPNIEAFVLEEEAATHKDLWVHRSCACAVLHGMETG